jgi:hypothetical protein
VILVMLVACDGIGTDIKNKITNWSQDLETKLEQSDIQLSPQIAITESLTVSTCMADPCLKVWLKPTTNAIADKEYTVGLYEKGVLRDTTTVKWNQPELNVSKTKVAHFELKQVEYDAYFGEVISHIFSVKVHE